MPARLLAFCCLLLALSACALQRSADADAARQQMVGMTAEQVLACMGPANRKAKEGATEVWAYTSTNGQKTSNTLSYKTPLKPFIDKSAKGNTSIGMGGGTSYKSACTVNIVMRDKRVVNVLYNGERGSIWAHDEQCGYAIEHCVRGH